LYRLCRALKYKAKLGVEIRTAYKNGDKGSLKAIAKKKIPYVIKRISEFEQGFCAQWMQENKDNGYQTQDLRLGGLQKQLQTVKKLLLDYTAGKIAKIYALEEDLVTIDGESALSMLLWKDWQYIHSVYVG
jgi:hypothetical protein